MVSAHFLLVYDLDLMELVKVTELGSDSDAAIAAYQACEKEYEGRDVEIVLVGSDSIETVRSTHRSYFAGEASRVRDTYLSGI